MKYAERQQLYSRIIGLTRLIAGGKHASKMRIKPSRMSTKIIHYYDTHTLTQCKVELARLKQRVIKLDES